MDRDPAIEICTWSQDLWKYNETNRVFQVDVTGNVSEDMDQATLKKAGILTLMANQYIIGLLMLAIIIILISWTIEAFFWGLAGLCSCLRKKRALRPIFDSAISLF